jgi:Kef-type K+ transport system membrane component KefB
MFGVLLPLAGGFVAAALYYGNLGSIDQNELLKNIFIGIILTATSVSITVEALREMGKLKGKAGMAILGAAIIDDIIGIVVLTILISFRDTSVQIGFVLLKILLFFVAIAVVGFVANWTFKKLCMRYSDRRRRMPIYSFVFCLLLAYGAEAIFGVADITGAYMAGIIITNISFCDTTLSEYVTEKVEVTSYMLLSPIFFASIGIKATVGQVDMQMILFSSALLAIAILTKMGGCGLGAKLSGFSKKDSWRIGAGMVARGEVALIVADRGVAAGLMSATLLTPIIILVIATSLFTPILLKLMYKGEIDYSHSKDEFNDLEAKICEFEVIHPPK